ncbi:uncharacterized protein LOC129592500 isoform X2 [Paramacrobiotus metropolitanus]|uniref:uncharacterized protein LOC129592500 isoform X2 n=1 Tax=Paramacrobiotus metropolitanus TaxID=2943436 RepID=UPI002445DA80|nr:uncharacterized protein LOC129592500 isoform X2 [Paramacrobiotus metropolitanus]
MEIICTTPARNIPTKSTSLIAAFFIRKKLAPFIPFADRRPALPLHRLLPEVRPPGVLLPFDGILCRPQGAAGRTFRLHDVLADGRVYRVCAAGAGVDDAHIRQIVRAGFTSWKNFHTMLYMCAPEFDFIGERAARCRRRRMWRRRRADYEACCWRVASDPYPLRGCTGTTSTRSSKCEERPHCEWMP